LWRADGAKPEENHVDELNTLAIAHQDGNLKFILQSGGYLIENGVILISVRTDAAPETEYPRCALFCLEHAIGGPLKVGDVFEGTSENEDGPPRACAYFGFHAESVVVKWEVRAIDGENVTLALTSDHDDVDYYDGRAKRTPTTGVFQLSPKSRRELWCPP
jgi:hypothetical protein